MHGTYIGNNKMMVKLAYNAVITIPSNDLSLMPTLVTTGMFEVPLTKYFLTQLKPGYTVVDVGANIGYFTVLAAKVVGNTGRVIGYEADPNTAAVLKDNLAMNWLTENVTIINKAVYSENKTLQFRSSERFHGYSSWKEKPQDDNLIDHYTIRDVEAVSLDNELQELDTIDLVKIDIEGGEYHAFLGMKKLIQDRKIKTITFEWNKAMLGADEGPFLDLISDLITNRGARLTLLDKEGEVVETTLKDLAAFEFYPFVLLEFQN
ncbi:FkbM family methyltransferase [Paenibacillus chitinolyticus]|uniref:FkbM family methyltransferase n=1 Tax=Paenibacillus chitinolyticus TaxID=79263 RepID=UPI003640CB18